MAAPGTVAAFAGATFLTSIPVGAAAPVVATILCGMGVYILARFAFDRSGSLLRVGTVPRWFLAPLGAVAGFMDAVGGGGWGPVGSSTLLASRRMEPRTVVGTMAAEEFLVTLGGFLLGLDAAQIPWRVAGALLVGGVLAAPLAAYVVRLLPARVMGTLVGGLIVVTNARTFLLAFGLDAVVGPVLYTVLAGLWLSAVAVAVRAARRERRQEPELSRGSDRGLSEAPHTR